jgi:DNA-directed RNA polymerase subunit beta'
VVVRPSIPETWHLSRSALLGLFLATRIEPQARGAAFRNRERVLEALEHGILGGDDTIRIGPRVTTVGRFLVAECFPATYGDEVSAVPCTAMRLANLLSRVMRDFHVEIAARSAEALELLGRRVADKSGRSPTRSDFEAAPEKDALVAEAHDEARAVQRDYQEALITDGERYHKTVDVWASAADRTRWAARTRGGVTDPLEAFAAADAETPKPDRVRGILGPCTKSNGEIFEAPILHTLGEGLTAHEFMMTCRAARGVILSQQERDRVARAMLHDLDAALGDTTITVRDCGTMHGVRVERLELEFETMSTLAARIEGRIAAADVSSRDGTVLAPQGALFTRRIAERIEAAHVPWVLVRDPLTCEAEEGICALCFGLDPDDATWLCPGDEIGSRAAINIAREARRFIERWVHIC